MRTSLCGFSRYVALGLGVLWLIGCSTSEKDRPNIILFLVDDLGWQDTSVPFWDDTTVLNRRFRTPNMVRLASQGMMFTQAYANGNCTPSRVSLITGMHAAIKWL